MNVRSFVSSPLATVLQNICGRYLIVEADPETLALELHRKQVTLRNVLLNTTAFNTELVCACHIRPDARCQESPISRPRLDWNFEEDM